MYHDALCILSGLMRSPIFYEGTPSVVVNSITHLILGLSTILQKSVFDTFLEHLPSSNLTNPLLSFR